MTVLDNVLSGLKKLRKAGEGWVGCCPAHDDRHPSLSISVGDDGRVLLHCFAGCTIDAIVAALGLELRDLYPEGEVSPPRGNRQVRQVVQGEPPLVTLDGDKVDSSEGLTLEALAATKMLPVEFLSALGCQTVRHFGPPAVQVPYDNEHGEIDGIRYRLARGQFRWRKGTKASMLLYGVSRLREIREAGYVVLVEGESDAWTLLHHGFPVLALPGAGMWHEGHAARLEGIETVYVVVEPDQGGETLVAKLRDSVIRARVRLVRLPTKDASELHLRDEASFARRFQEALEAATTLLAVEEERRRTEAATEWDRCRDLALEREILSVFETELRARGFVGSTDTPKLIFLVLVSRLLARPVSLVLRGLSSAGKSYNVESVLPFFPSTAYFGRSGMSERALVYSDEEFRHRILYIAEADAIAGEGLSAYFLRTLISENKLVYETVERGGDRMATRVIEKPGPTGVILTTTKLHLDAETETRMLALTVPDNRELTRQIMRAIALRDDDAAKNPPPEEWPAHQRWLELGGERRVIDQSGFLLVLAEMIPTVAVRQRRDFALVRSLIFAHAILHQATRPRDPQGRIVATLDDYEAIRQLIGVILAEGIGATVPDDVRETVAAVTAALERQHDRAGVRRAQVQAQLGLDQRATNRRLSQAVDAGVVENTNPGRGKAGLYKLGQPIPENIEVLPTVDDLRHNLDTLDNQAQDQSDTPHPPPLKPHQHTEGESPSGDRVDDTAANTDGASEAQHEPSLEEALLDPGLWHALGFDEFCNLVGPSEERDPNLAVLERHQLGPHGLAEICGPPPEPTKPGAPTNRSTGKLIGTCILCGASVGDEDPIVAAWNCQGWRFTGYGLRNAQRLLASGPYLCSTCAVRAKHGLIDPPVPDDPLEPRQ